MGLSARSTPQYRTRNINVEPSADYSTDRSKERWITSFNVVFVFARRFVGAVVAIALLALAGSLGNNLSRREEASFDNGITLKRQTLFINDQLSGKI